MFYLPFIVTDNGAFDYTFKKTFFPLTNKAKSKENTISYYLEIPCFNGIL
ncbi:hypothetical protein NY10_1772 [Carnobacterium antarcticum]|nr:hypothetical protein NY10_1772 [Carnobacterium sp. CP1]